MLNPGMTGPNDCWMSITNILANWENSVGLSVRGILVYLSVVLIRYLLRLLKGSDVDCAYAYVFNSRLSALEFLRYISADLGLASWGKKKAELLHDLSKYLIARYQKKLTTVVVVDEAHQMATDVLEEIRFLTNLETTEQKLLQVLLVGQPELAERLDSFDLRQLKQRIASTFLARARIPRLPTPVSWLSSLTRCCRESNRPYSPTGKPAATLPTSMMRCKPTCWSARHLQNRSPVVCSTWLRSSHDPQGYVPHPQETYRLRRRPKV